MLRRILAVFISMVMLFTMASCKNKTTDDINIVNVWVLSEDYAEYIEWVVDNYCSDKGFTVDVQVVDFSDISAEIENSVCKGKIPDIIMMAPENIESMAVNRIIVPFDSLGIRIDKDRYYDFAINAGVVDGVQYAMCWHASPGLFAYRRSISKAYLGTDDPAEIESLIKDKNSFLDVAQLIKASSLGNTYMLVGLDDAARVYWGGDYSAITHEAAAEYFEFAKKLYDDGLVYGADQWSDAWTAGFNDSSTIFGYYLSEIAVNDVLFRVCNESNGDWAAAVPFSPYAWGGAYLGVYSESDNRESASELLYLLTADESVMTRVSLYSGMFSANKNVNNSVASDARFESSVFGGQNYFKVLMRSAEMMDKNSAQKKEDTMIISLLNTCAENYILGEYDVSAAVDTFFASVDSFND